MKKRKIIKSMSDLKQERRRLKAEIAEKELLLKADVQTLRDSLKPFNMISNFAGGKFLTKENDSVLNKGINSAVTFALRNVLLANSGWIVKLIVPMIARNFANNKFEEHKADIVGTVRDWLHKFKEKRKEKTNGHYDKSTADININL